MATTTNIGLNYPVSTDNINLMYQQIQTLAEDVDDLFTWASYTPTIDQGASTNIAKTVTFSQWCNMGDFALWQFVLTLTASGSALSIVTLTLPTNCDRAGLRTTLGSGVIWDSSATSNDTGSWVAQSASTIAFLYDSTASLNSRWGVQALASGDIICGQLMYKKA